MIAVSNFELSDKMEDFIEINLTISHKLIY